MISTDGTVNVQNQGWTTKCSNTKTHSLSSVIPMHKNATAKNATVSSGNFLSRINDFFHESMPRTKTKSWIHRWHVHIPLYISKKKCGETHFNPASWCMATIVPKYFRDALFGACVYTGVSRWHYVWIVEKTVMLPRKRKERLEKINPNCEHQIVSRNVCCLTWVRLKTAQNRNNEKHSIVSDDVWG